MLKQRRPTYTDYRRYGHKCWVAFALAHPVWFYGSAMIIGAAIGVWLTHLIP